MKILITGAGGQIGQQAAVSFKKKGAQVICLERGQIDLADSSATRAVIEKHRADWVLNCAAYTKVDKAEEERDLAFQVNRDGAEAVAQGVAEYGGKLVHLSTDFVFDGQQSRPYREEDAAKPVNVYGLTKLAGEGRVLATLPEAVILRTAWVYGIHGHNFPKTILRLAAEREELSVVDDQIGTPSAAPDICNAIWGLINAESSGIFHFTNEGVASWYDFAVEIVGEARRVGLPVKTRLVKPISSRDFPTQAVRPAYSVLSKEKIRPLLEPGIAYWRDSLFDIVRALGAAPR